MLTKRDKTEPGVARNPGEAKTQSGASWAAKRSQCEVAIERGL